MEVMISSDIQISDNFFWSSLFLFKSVYTLLRQKAKLCFDGHFCPNGQTGNENKKTYRKKTKGINHQLKMKAIESKKSHTVINKISYHRAKSPKWKYKNPQYVNFALKEDIPFTNLSPSDINTDFWETGTSNWSLEVGESSLPLWPPGPDVTSWYTQTHTVTSRLLASTFVLLFQLGERTHNGARRRRPSFSSASRHLYGQWIFAIDGNSSVLQMKLFSKVKHRRRKCSVWECDLSFSQDVQICLFNPEHAAGERKGVMLKLSDWGELGSSLKTQGV